MQSSIHPTVTSGREASAAAAQEPGETAPHLNTLADSYDKVRRATEALCEPLAIEDFVVQSLPEASPVKWHLAHTSWYFEKYVLAPFASGYRVYDSDFGALFEPDARPLDRAVLRGALSRPTVEQILDYRRHVDGHMHALLESRSASEELWRAVTLGLHREQQHQERLIADLKHAFWCNPLQPIYAELRPAQSMATPLEFIEIEGGLAEIGHEGRGFSFECELPRHPFHVQPFRLANRLITNAEYRDFMSCDGYARPEYWLPEGWNLLERERWEHPLYWEASLESEFTLSGPAPIDPCAPVSHLSFYEAEAFARWAGARLPSEFEWELAAACLPVHGNFVEEEYWRPIPPPATDGLLQMFGDAWEGTRSGCAPYPRHAASEGPASELYGRFPADQLVLRGGSCLTARSHMRATYRHVLRPAARWQVTGNRLAMDA